MPSGSLTESFSTVAVMLMGHSTVRHQVRKATRPGLKSAITGRIRSSRRLIPYLGGDVKDDSHMIGDYISVSSHSTTRGMSIDRKNPVFMKGVPYTLYPIYGAGSTSLYYIGHGTNYVKLDVATNGR
jgi:hypothetical protein